MLDLLLISIILSAVTYRIGRFLLLDDLISGWRDRFFLWLNKPEQLSAFRWKTYELLTCPYCITVWIAGAVTLIADATTSVPLPAFAWLAASSGSLVFWNYIDGE